MQLCKFLFPPLIRVVLALYLVSIVAPAVLSQQKPTKKLNVAVLDFEDRGGVTKQDAASLSDVFQGKIIETNEFIVVDRNRIKAILNEQGFQQSEACSQVECVAEVGKILRVEKMFVGTIGKVGKIFTVNIQLVDVATAQIVQNKSRTTDGSIEELLTDIIPDLAGEMASELAGKKIEVSKSSGGGTWLWYVGGIVLAGAGVAAILSSSKKDEGPTNPSQQSQQLPDSPNFP